MQICRCKVSDIITKRKKKICAKLTFCKKEKWRSQKLTNCPWFIHSFNENTSYNKKEITIYLCVPLMNKID